MIIFSRFSRYFDELVKHGSIRAAAEHLRVAPSAINRLLLQAEEELGTPLFERRPTGLRLTAAGELLVHGARTWRRDLQRVLAQIDDLKGLRRGSVSVAVVEGTTQDLVPLVLASFTQQYPQITFDVKVAARSDVERLVLAGEADIGLMFNPTSHKGLRIQCSLTYKMGVLLRPKHPLAKMGDLRLSDLTGHPVIIPDETTSLRGVLDDALKASGVTLQPIATVNHVSLIRTLVLHDVGVGLLTEIGALPEIEDGSIVFRPLIDSGIRSSTMCLVTAVDRHLPLPVTLLVQEFTELMKPPYSKWREKQPHIRVVSG